MSDKGLKKVVFSMVKLRSKVVQEILRFGTCNHQGAISVRGFKIMSHEINDNVKKPSEEAKGDAGLNLLTVNEGDRSENHVEASSEALEANERAIEQVRARIAEIARRAAALGLTEEPHHMETMKQCCEKGAANGEPAYVEMKKHLK